MKKVNIKGSIVSNDVKWIYDWFGIEATSPGDVEKALIDANGEDVVVEINSGGGLVFAGSEIYTALKNYSGNVSVDIVGLAASAASLPASAGNPTRISPTAQIMIHNASGSAKGDYREMEFSAEFLKNINKSIANAYILKTGMSQDKLLNLMDQETWLNAQQAKELGFADEIMFDTSNQLVASFNNSTILPPEVISKIRNYLEKNPGAIVSDLQQIPLSGNDAVNAIKNENPETLKKEGAEEMEIKNLQDLQTQCPSVYDEALKAGAAAERTRLQAIDGLVGKVDNQLLNDAKYVNAQTAEQVALTAMNEGKFVNTAVLGALKTDASTTDKVKGEGEEVTDKDEEASILASVTAIAQNTVKGGK